MRIDSPLRDYPYYRFISDPFDFMLCRGYTYKSMNLIKSRMCAKGYIYYFICVKFESSGIKNGLRNTQQVQITN